MATSLEFRIYSPDGGSHGGSFQYYSLSWAIQGCNDCLGVIESMIALAAI